MVELKTGTLFFCSVIISAILGYSTGRWGTDSLRFELLSEHSTGFTPALSIQYDKLDRPYYYVTAAASGLLVFDVSNPNQPEPIKSLPITEFASLNVMNLFQQGPYLYLALGGHFVGGQPEKGLGIVDISDPTHATMVDVWHEAEGNGAGVVVVEGDYAYLGAMSQGLIILDISDKNDVRFVSQLIPDINFPWPNPDQSQRDKINARGMALKDNTIYLSNDAGGLRIIDVTDKANPQEIGRYINTTVELMAYNNVAVKDDLAYVPIDYCGLEILDVGNPANITQVGWYNPWDCNHPADWFSSDGHTNEIVLMAEQELAFLSAGDSELTVVNVSDPAQPTLAGSFGEPGNSQGTWGLDVHDQMVLLTYIRTLGIPFRSTWAGVKLLEWNTIVGVEEHPELPTSQVITLEQNYPNPFRVSTTIQFEVPVASDVELVVYNTAGRKVRTLQTGRMEAGRHHVHWDGRDDQGLPVASGAYLVKINALTPTNQNVKTEKMLLMR
jgi:hypothetical protein